MYLAFELESTKRMITVFETIPFDLPGNDGSGYPARRRVGLHGVTDAQYQFYVPFDRESDPSLHPQLPPSGSLLYESIPSSLFMTSGGQGVYKSPRPPTGSGSGSWRKGLESVMTRDRGAIGLLFRQFIYIAYLLLDYIRLLILTVEYVIQKDELLRVMCIFIFVSWFVQQRASSL